MGAKPIGKRFYRALAVLCGFATLAIGLGISLRFTDTAIRLPSVTVVVAAVGMGLVFIGLKAVSLRSSCHAAGVRLSFARGARLMCEGVAVECLTWPGKLCADAYRVRMLERGSTRERLGALVTFRCTAIAATLITLASACLVVQGLSTIDLIVLVGLLLLVALLLWRRVGRIKCSATPTARVGHISLALTAGVMAVGVDAAAAALIAWSITDVDPLIFAGFYLVCSVLASASGVPMGLGVADAAGWVVLTGAMGVEPGLALSAVLAHRAFGPTVTLLIGSVLMLQRGMAWGRPALPSLPQFKASQPAASQRRALAFSLVELVMVVMIIGIITAIAVPRLTGMSEKAYLAKAQELDANLERAIILYLQEQGKMPKKFDNWVGLDSGASDRNYIQLKSFRPLLANPDNNVLIDEKTIRMQFKSGLTVEYKIDDNGILTSTYTDP